MEVIELPFFIFEFEQFLFFLLQNLKSIFFLQLWELLFLNELIKFLIFVIEFEYFLYLIPIDRGFEVPNTDISLLQPP